jgi:hypothetical protein
VTAAGPCLHLAAIGYTDPEKWPEQDGLAPGQVRCLNPACRQVFMSDRAWCKAQDRALSDTRRIVGTPAAALI